MHFSVILRVTGILLSLFSITMLPPMLVAFSYDEATITAFGMAFGITSGVGMLLWALVRSAADLRSRDGFLITALFYLSLGTFGALPFWLHGGGDLTFTDAIFESLSGLTTTGATIMTGLDDLPRSILFYRQFLQWLGGMGIIVLAVAILPMLGIGGMQLYRAESPGPVKDTKLTPRITETAKALWYIYLSITVLCAIFYNMAGMDAFDAICHSFATVAIGGFSTHDASLGYFNSPAIEAVAMVFMLVAAVNFGLHFAVLSRRRPGYYFRDWEVRTLVGTLLLVAGLVCLILYRNPDSTDQPFRAGIFQAVSIATTTGFTTADFSRWPSVAPVLLLLAAFAGGCAGSTAGGLKMVRVLLIYLQGLREVRRLIHPAGVFPVKLGNATVSDRVMNAVWGFFAAYVLIFLIMLCAIMLFSEVDFVTAFSAVGACLNNLGPGLGDVALNYAGQTDTTKWILILAMLLGRLEIFTLLVLLTPAFWRR